MKTKTEENLIKLWKIFIVILINVLVIVMVTINMQGGTAEAVTFGSQGDTVREIQKALKYNGYYNGEIDGIFGDNTKTAVMNFQRDSGLKADGIVGEKTLSALGINKSANTQTGSYGSLNEADFNLLARIISAEARGEPYMGQVAVGAVILNRVEHPSFPNTIAGVIYQPGAVSCLYDGQVNAAGSDSAYKAAREAVNGSDPSGGAIYYYNPVKSTNKWIFSRPVITVIGAHRFCS